MEWLLAKRSGVTKTGEQNSQLELTDSLIPFNVLVQQLKGSLEKARKHQNETARIARQNKLSIQTLGEKEIILFTDLSAMMDLCVAKTENCSIDNHAVLDTFIILHSPRTVTVIKDGKEVEKTTF
jgi:hypothetical protein